MADLLHLCPRGSREASGTVKLMKTLTAQDMLMAELRPGEASSQRNYTLVMVKDGGSSYSGSHSRAGAFTSQGQALKSSKPLHLTLFPTTSRFLSSKNSELCQDSGLEVLTPKPTQPLCPPIATQASSNSPPAHGLWAEFPSRFYLWDLKECLLGHVLTSWY